VEIRCETFFIGKSASLVVLKGENFMAQVNLINLWLSKNPSELDAHAGKWVALSEKGIVAVAATLKELLKVKGVNPKTQVVHKVPTEEEYAGFY
jgi:hypothetical protein